MTSINKLELTKALAKSELFTVKKGFLGMGTKMTYVPTGSNVKAEVLEYSLTDAEQLERIMRMDKAQMVKSLQSANLQAAHMGNARLEVLKSEDGACVVMQLFRFADFSFRAASEVIILEGEDAEAVSKIY